MISEDDARWSINRELDSGFPPGNLSSRTAGFEMGDMQEALRESTSRYETLVDTVPVGIIELDRSGRLVFCNSVGARLAGYTAAEVRGRDIGEFLISDTERERLRAAFADILSSEPYPRPYFTQARRKDGRAIDLQVNWNYKRDSHGAITGFISSVMDVTESKRTEEALRYTQCSVDRAIDSIVWSKMSGEIVYVNDAVCRETGYSRGELLSMSIMDINPRFSPDDRNMHQVLKERGKKGNPLFFETSHRGKDGRVYPVEVSANYLRYDRNEYICAVVRDISERKLAEEALLESEAKYRNLVEHSLVGFYIIQDDLFRFVNKRFCQIHGYTYKEVVDRLGPTFNVHPEDSERVKENLVRRLSGQTGNVDYEFRAQRKDGQLMTVRAAGSATVYNGRPAVMGTIIDITREKTLESQLQQAQKMEAIGTLAGGVAHDFNNILTALIGYSKLLQMKMSAEDPLRDYVDNILVSSEKAAGLTQNLLAFSRNQVVQLKPVKISGVIKSVEKLLARLLTEDIELKIMNVDTEITVMADGPQMDQVLLNLATNARDAMPTGGRLVINTKEVRLTSRFIKNYGRIEPGRYAVISLADTGQGMDEKTKDKIFEPFFTTKDAGRGTGLGLSIVYGIVKHHRGFITVYSEPGRGTIFRVYLPVVGEGLENSNTIPSTAALGGIETILVAEDDDLVRKIMIDVLSGAGYRTIEAIDGEDAIAKFTEGRDAISLVMLDVVMPKKNGKEAFDEMRRLRPDVSIIFATGYTGDVVLDKGITDREYDLLRKPVLPNDLLLKVREVLDRPR